MTPPSSPQSETSLSPQHDASSSTNYAPPNPDVNLGGSSPINQGLPLPGYGAVSDEDWGSHINLFQDPEDQVYSQNSYHDQHGYIRAAIYLVALIIVLIYAALIDTHPTHFYRGVTDMEAYYMGYIVCTTVILSIATLYSIQFNISIVTWGIILLAITLLDFISAFFWGPLLWTLCWVLFCSLLGFILWTIFSSQGLFWSPALQHTSLLVYLNKFPSTFCLCAIFVLQSVVVSKIFYAAFIQLQVAYHGHGFIYYLLSIFLIFTYILSQETMVVFLNAIICGAAAAYWVNPEYEQSTWNSVCRAFTTASGSLLALGQDMTVFHLIDFIRRICQRFVIFTQTQPTVTFVVQLSTFFDAIQNTIKQVITLHKFSTLRIMLYGESLAAAENNSAVAVEQRHPYWNIVLTTNTSTLLLKVQLFFIVLISSRISRILVDLGSWSTFVPMSSYVRAYWFNLALSFYLAQGIFVPMIKTIDTTAAVFTMEPRLISLNDSVAYTILDTASQDELTSLHLIEPSLSPQDNQSADANQDLPIETTLEHTQSQHHDELLLSNPYQSDQYP